MTKKLQKAVKWIVKNWKKIPSDQKTMLMPGKSSNPLKNGTIEDNIVFLLIDRQKPSVEADYSFDEERFGVTSTGKILWGFDSGCSCPSPWDDSYPSCYNLAKTWKQFQVELSYFDVDFEKEALDNLKKLKETMKKKRVSKS